MVLVLAGLVTGCVVTSVYPFYTKKELVFDPALVGKWAETHATNSSSEYISIEPLSRSDKAYWLTLHTPKRTSSSELHLFRLENHLFLDTYSTNRALDYIPVHQVSKVIQLNTTLKTASLNDHWLASQLRKHPHWLRHIWLHDHPGRQNKAGDGRLVLTADTSELQQFLRRHVNDTNAWNQPSSLQRLH